MVPPKAFGPYVPCDRLVKILEEYRERYGLTWYEIAREIAANQHENEDAWCRRLYSWRYGESETCRFDMADKALSSLYLIDCWYDELSDIYERAA